MSQKCQKVNERAGHAICALSHRHSMSLEYHSQTPVERPLFPLFNRRILTVCLCTGLSHVAHLEYDNMKKADSVQRLSSIPAQISTTRLCLPVLNDVVLHVSLDMLYAHPSSADSLLYRVFSMYPESTKSTTLFVIRLL